MDFWLLPEEAFPEHRTPLFYIGFYSWKRMSSHWWNCWWNFVQSQGIMVQLCKWRGLINRDLYLWKNDITKNFIIFSYVPFCEWSVIVLGHRPAPSPTALFTIIYLVLYWSANKFLLPLYVAGSLLVPADLCCCAEWLTSSAWFNLNDTRL